MQDGRRGQTIFSTEYSSDVTPVYQAIWKD